MDAGKKREYELLELIRTGKPMTWSERLDLIVRLSIPSILAQLSVIVMLYIDASMVGSLGANASASIGLVSTTTWLFSGVCTAAATGFSVQVALLIQQQTDGRGCPLPRCPDKRPEENIYKAVCGENIGTIVTANN